MILLELSAGIIINLESKFKILSAPYSSLLSIYYKIMNKIFNNEFNTPPFFNDASLLLQFSC